MQDGKATSATSAVTISIDDDVLQQARHAGLDLQSIVDRALRSEIARLQHGAQWRDENRSTIVAWNEDVRVNGLWSDGLRQF